MRLEPVGELAEELLAAPLGQPGPHHLAEESVGHADLPAVAVDLDLEQRPAFELVDAAARHEGHQVVEGDRLADRDELDDLALARRRAARGGARPPPRAGSMAPTRR